MPSIGLNKSLKNIKTESQSRLKVQIYLNFKYHNPLTKVEPYATKS